MNDQFLCRAVWEVERDEIWLTGETRGLKSGWHKKTRRDIVVLFRGFYLHLEESLGNGLFCLIFVLRLLLERNLVGVGLFFITRNAMVPSCVKIIFNISFDYQPMTSKSEILPMRVLITCRQSFFRKKRKKLI